MNELIRRMLEAEMDAFDQRLLSDGKVNYNVFERRLHVHSKFTKEPKFMYFYYVRINEDGTLKVSHFWYVDGDRSDSSTWQTIPWQKPKLEGIVRTLAENARKTSPNNPPPCDQINFRDIIWRQKSYIVVFFDELNWKFVKKSATSDPIVFITDKNGNGAVGNHTFFDALELEIKFSSTNVRSAVVFINHMKADEEGNDLGDASEEFAFNMVLGAKFSDGTDAPLTVIFDPGGTNTGPPIEE